LGTGRWIRIVSTATIPELIGKLYNKRLRTDTACVAAMIVFGLVTLESQTLDIGISAMSGWSLGWSAVFEKIIKRSLWIAGPINGLFGVFPVLVGLAAATIPEFSELGPKLAGATLIVKLLPTWLVVLLQARFLGALLSTFVMSALAPATIFAKDIVSTYVEGGLSPKQEKNIIRYLIIVIGIIAAGMTFFLHPNVILAITWLFAWLVPFFYYRGRPFLEAKLTRCSFCSNAFMGSELVVVIH
jgi:SSS family solute:Na+ symporter